MARGLKSPGEADLESFIIGFIVVIWGFSYLGKAMGFANPGPVYDQLTVLVVALISQYVTRRQIERGDGRAASVKQTGAPTGEQDGSLDRSGDTTTDDADRDNSHTPGEE